MPHVITLLPGTMKIWSETRELKVTVDPQDQSLLLARDLRSNYTMTLSRYLRNTIIPSRYLKNTITPSKYLRNTITPCKVPEEYNHPFKVSEEHKSLLQGT